MATDGFRSLAPGQDVELEWEAAEQDGYPFRTTRVWPRGQVPVAPAPTAPDSDAYRSSLTITYDDA